MFILLTATGSGSYQSFVGSRRWKNYAPTDLWDMGTTPVAAAHAVVDTHPEYFKGMLRIPVLIWRDYDKKRKSFCISMDRQPGPMSRKRK